jgi:hypothetical protein
VPCDGIVTVTPEPRRAMAVVSTSVSRKVLEAFWAALRTNVEQGRLYFDSTVYIIFKVVL